MTDEELLGFAFSTLSRELGLYGYASFLRLYRPGTGDYTRDRHKWQESLTMEDIIAQTKNLAK